MARIKLTFRQRDVTAAIRAMEAAGHVVDRVEISPDGRIVVIPVKSGKDAVAGDINEWDTELENPACALITTR